jgi:hypothetical protein
MEAICSSETSVATQQTTRRHIPQDDTLQRYSWCLSTWVATQQTTRRHIPEDDTLHNHRCENLKSYKNIFIPKASKRLFVIFISQEGNLVYCNNVDSHMEALDQQDGHLSGPQSWKLCCSTIQFK